MCVAAVNRGGVCDRGFEVEVSNQKKRIVVLCTLLVVGGGWVGLASRYAGGHDQAAPSTAGTALSFPADANLPAPAGLSLGGRELFLKMMLSVGLVIGLGAAAVYLSKRVLPRVANVAGKEIRVLETTYLGPRKALHLVEVAHQRLLIASTNDHITTLAHLNDAWLDMARQESEETVKA
jgi:flagellar biosynthetic protein FliO